MNNYTKEDKERLKPFFTGQDKLAWREARAKVRGARERRLKDYRARQQKQNPEVERQRKMIIDSLEAVGVSSIESCLGWAFGIDNATIPLNTWTNRWNMRWGKSIFKIYPTDSIQETFMKIGKAFITFVVNPRLDKMRSK